MPEEKEREGYEVCGTFGRRKADDRFAKYWYRGFSGQ
jgi:hypothetical protein